jgi:hypothetical protein
MIELLFNDAEESGFCLAHFINDGVQLSGNTATFEFVMSLQVSVILKSSSVIWTGKDSNLVR